MLLFFKSGRFALLITLLLHVATPFYSSSSSFAPPMADPTPSQSSMARRSSSWPLGLLTLILAPVAAAMLLYQLDPYDPAPVPIHEFSQQPMVVPKLNPRMLQGSEMIGVGKLLSPEDIAYHPDSHLIYTGCDDGWVKRITLNDSMVQNWAFTGGRPLGVALGRHGQLVVADAEKVGK